MNFKNLLLGLRNIRKNGIYSIINFVGLALGLAVVVLILFWVSDELAYDGYNTRLSQMYSVYEHQQYSEGKELYTGCTPFPLAHELTANFPEVERATTYANLDKLPIKYQDKEFKEGPVICTDTSFLDVFTYTLLEGDRNSLASNQVIITEDLAKQFFGDESAIGKILLFDGEVSVPIGAVLAQPEKNASLRFKVLAPLKILERGGNRLDNWGNNWPSTCLLLTKDANVSALDKKISGLCKEKGQVNTTLHLFPYKKTHLYSYSNKNNRIQYIYLFLAIAFIIILIASINFINLSISKAEHRRSEVGVRKVLGAGRINILRQFFIEKGIMILISIGISILLIILFLPAFQSVADKQIRLSQIQSVSLVLLLISVLIVVLALSVVYPSLYLASINAVQALKKTGTSNKGSFYFRNLLITIQFCLSIILICGSIIVAKQIRYLNQFDLGYNRSNLVFLSLDGMVGDKSAALKQEYVKLTGIESITFSDKLPFWGGNSSWGHQWEGKDPENKVLICKMNVDNNYFNTLGIKLVEGEGFPASYDKVLSSEEFKVPQVILNKEAIKRMNLSSPVGKSFSPWGGDKGIIVGIVEDFHFESLRSEIEPLLLLPMLGRPGFMIIRIKPENYTQTINEIKQTWKKVIPETQCDLGFFDRSLERMYQSEVRMASLIRHFTFVAIFISCIGLFGLSLFVIERRRKEIGVRKVNGARTSEVMILLNKNFVKWVAIAFAVSVPLAWIIMSKWLENFAYKTTLSWWVFALAGMLALGIALLTVSWQSWRAATRNPVESLRYE